MTEMTLEEVIIKAHTDVLFGNVNVQVKKAGGHVTTVDVTKTSRQKVSGNAEALTMIGTMLKLLCQAEETGNLTFTITMDRGEATQFLTHDYRRHNLKSGQLE